MEYRWRMTLMYCFVAFFRCAVQKMTGPALVPIARQVGLSEGDMGSLGFATAASGCGYVVGAAAGGPLVDRFPGRQHVIVALAILTEAASTMVIPFATRLDAVAALLFVDGMGNGIMLPALTVSLVWMWGRDVAPKMQLFSAMFLGTVFSTATVGLDLEVTGDYRHGFWGISGGQLLLCALPPLFMTAPERPSASSAKPAADAGGDDDESAALVGEDSPEGSEGHGGRAGGGRAAPSSAMVIGHAGLIIFCYCAAEGMIGTWLATFVFLKRLAPEPVAALFVSAFWGGLVAARFAAVWLAGRVGGEALILGCFCLAGSAMGLGFVLAPAVAEGAPPGWLLWVATALYGFGCGPVFGACNSLPAQHGVDVSGTQMTMLQLGVSAGNTAGYATARHARISIRLQTTTDRRWLLPARQQPCSDG